MSGERPTVSVIVCTRNRCTALVQLLESLTHLAIPSDLAWELVVVDNGSTDGTALLLDSYADQLPVRRIYEARQGLSRARNAGLAAAEGEILAFTDDDCIPAPDWLDAIVREFTNDADLAGLGGRVELYDPSDYPITIRTSRTREVLTSAQQLPALMVGCNMAFRRETVDAIGEFDVTLGAGTPAGSAEDTDYLYRALLLGLRIEYVPDILVAHNHGRRRVEEVAQLRRSYARGRGALLTKYLLRADRGMAYCAYCDLRWNGGELVRALRSWQSPRAVMERGFYMLAGAARWVESALLPVPLTLDEAQHTGHRQLLAPTAETQ